METTIFEILDEMAEHLSIEQQKKLQQVLVKKLSGNTAVPEKITNTTYLQMFLDAKKVEGCSERTLKYYHTTLEKFFGIITMPVRRVTTERIRQFLAEYQQINNCSNATIDNVRRNISSFFSWLEEEDYILKSPMHRIHKIKTKKH